MKFIIIILTAFFACQISKTNAEGFPFKWPHPNDDKWLVLADTSNDENRAYLACNAHRRHSTRKTARDCIVGHHKVTHTKEDHVCDVKIRVTQKGNAYIGDEPTIRLFGEDKVIVYWRVLGPKTVLRIRIISMNGCKTTDTIIPDDVTETFRSDFEFAFSNKSFDVFFKNDTCGDKMCWMTIDDEGKVINGPIGYYEAKDRSVPVEVKRIDRDAPEKGHLFSEKAKGGGVDYFLRKPDGTEKLLAHSLEIIRYGKSVANNLIGVCFKTATATKCAQYDSDGKVKLEVSMDLPKSMYNSANGGFLFISEHKQKCKLRDCIWFYLVAKIDANGTMLGNFECSGDTQYQALYQNEEGKYCLRRPCVRETSDGNSTVQCFDDTIFSK